MSKNPAKHIPTSNLTSSPELGSQQRWIIGSLMLAMAVAALEQTVVSPAMPSIITELNGFEIYPWVFSVYLLSATVSTPIYGKLADLWGRKRLLLFGLAVFSLGSALSGLSWSMPSLIGFRLIQGLGAGAIMPIVLTILGDVFSLEQRARVQGWFSAVWGISSLVGPPVGGWLTDQLSWRWVFLVTLPYSLLASAVLFVTFREQRETSHSQKFTKIDWIGAGLLTLATTSLLFGVLSQGRAGHTVPPLGWLALAVISTVCFLVWEKRVSDPILPLDLFQMRTVSAGVLGSFLIGTVIFGIDTYVPLYVQGVMGGRATDAGKLLIPLFLAWALSVAVAAKIVKRYGFRNTALIGNALISVGLSLLVLGATFPKQVIPLFVIGHMITGFGMGPTSLSYILAVQNVVSWNRRGAATGAVSFFRTIGGALGVGILGAVLAWGLSNRITDPAQIAQVLESHGQQPREAGALLVTVQARDALGLSLRDVLGFMLIMSVFPMACALQLPDREATNRNPGSVGKSPVSGTQPSGPEETNKEAVPILPIE